MLTTFLILQNLFTFIPAAFSTMPSHLDPSFFPHILAAVLSSLDFRDLLRARLVCSSMRKLADFELERGPLILSVRDEGPPRVLTTSYSYPGLLPSASMHSSTRSRAWAVRNVRQVILINVKPSLLDEVNGLLQHVGHLTYAFISDRNIPPGLSFRIPSADHLEIDVPDFRSGYIRVPSAENLIHHKATRVYLNMHGSGDCYPDSEDSDPRSYNYFNFDGLMNVGLQELDISGGNSLQTLEHFKRPGATCSPELKVTAGTSHHLPPRYRAEEVVKRCVQLFGIPEEQVCFVHDGRNAVDDDNNNNNSDGDDDGDGSSE